MAPAIGTAEEAVGEGEGRRHFRPRPQRTSSLSVSSLEDQKGTKTSPQTDWISRAESKIPSISSSLKGSVGALVRSLPLAI
jgi:hypothetical protein